MENQDKAPPHIYDRQCRCQACQWFELRNQSTMYGLEQARLRQRAGEKLLQIPSAYGYEARTVESHQVTEDKV